MFELRTNLLFFFGLLSLTVSLRTNVPFFFGLLSLIKSPYRGLDGLITTLIWLRLRVFGRTNY